MGQGIQIMSTPPAYGALPIYNSNRSTRQTECWSDPEPRRDVILAVRGGRRARTLWQLPGRWRAFRLSIAYVRGEGATGAGGGAGKWAMERMLWLRL
jgi:hypothetical protein